jgi:hypothetical protein
LDRIVDFGRASIVGMITSVIFFSTYFLKRGWERISC